MRAVVLDFAEGRAGRHARAFLGVESARWRGTPWSAMTSAAARPCSSSALPRAAAWRTHGASFTSCGWSHQSAVAEGALKFFVQLYGIEREVLMLDPDERRRIRQLEAKPVAELMHAWLIAQRQRVPDGSAAAKAIDYSVNRWAALTRYIDDGDLPPDNIWAENQIRPIALGRNNWLFAGSLRVGKRAAAVMSLVHTGQGSTGHEPCAYLKDVLEPLPTQQASRIDELLPHRWILCLSN